MFYAQGGHSAHTDMGGVGPRNFQATQKYHFSFPATQKYQLILYLETIQIEVRIAYSEPRNIILTMFGIKKYHEHCFSFLWTRKYHLSQCSDPTISDLPSCVHMLSAPWGFMALLIK